MSSNTKDDEKVKIQSSSFNICLRSAFSFSLKVRLRVSRRNSAGAGWIWRNRHFRCAREDARRFARGRIHQRLRQMVSNLTFFARHSLKNFREILRSSVFQAKATTSGEVEFRAKLDPANIDTAAAYDFKGKILIICCDHTMKTFPLVADNENNMTGSFPLMAAEPRDTSELKLMLTVSSINWVLRAGSSSLTIISFRLK